MKILNLSMVGITPPPQKYKHLKMRFNDLLVFVSEISLLSEIASTLVTESYLVQNSVRL